MKNKNLMFTDFEAQDGDVFDGCNLAQKKAHTKLKCFGSKVKFINCNLMNVELWPEAEVENCLTCHAEVIEEVVVTDVKYIEDKIEELTKDFDVELIKQVVSAKLSLAPVKAVIK